MYENCFSNFCEISAYFRRSYFWNTVYSEKGGVTRILSHLFILKMRILLSNRNIGIILIIQT
ncbi:hypothetical protein FKB33_05045 [Enterococcus faecium]|nr:hypothetical protein [Enterococcus faecium]